MNFNSGNGGSLIQARSNLPVGIIILIVIIIAVVLTALWFISKMLLDYKKSDKFINKEKNKPTKHSDVVKFCKENNFNNEQISLLWEVFSITKSPNIMYFFNSYNDVIELFRLAIEKFSAIGIDDEDLFQLFQLEYKLELLLSKKKGLLSTTGIPINTTLLYISDSGDQLPFKLIKNNQDAMYFDVPEHFYKSPHKPKSYVKQRFIYKNNEGVTYNFEARIIRFTEVTKEEEKIFIMVVSHTDKLFSTAQRNFKRDFCDYGCHILPVKITINPQNKKAVYNFTNNLHKSRLTNISAGGCCIQSNMPLKEKQNIGIILDDMGIEEKIVGNVKRTRRLPNGEFALHIQFVKISIKTKNEILKRIYKYEI
ncbi:MAG: PilZ domain-containing protein [Treponema sp.]|nr:PilZ domain-containing protein [Treponema sp.]